MPAGHSALGRSSVETPFWGDSKLLQVDRRRQVGHCVMLSVCAMVNWSVRSADRRKTPGNEFPKQYRGDGREANKRIILLQVLARVCDSQRQMEDSSLVCQIHSLISGSSKRPLFPQPVPGTTYISLAFSLCQNIPNARHHVLAVRFQATAED